MLCYTVLCITLQASTKSKLRATHVHHGQVLNILKDISNTGKRTIHNNTGKQESYVNNQHHVTTWTDTVGSPQQHNRPNTHTTWPGHVLMGGWRSWSKATSCESKTVSCAPHPPTFSHLTIDKSRRQVHTAVDHARYEVTAQPRLHTSTHRTHSRTFVHISCAPQDETPKLNRAARPALSSDVCLSSDYRCFPLGKRLFVC